MKRLLILAALLAAPVHAAPLAFDGPYRFNTTERGADHNPVCTEIWTFAAPDRMTVNSGEEVVESRFRTETDRDGNWLVTRRLSTNSAPDCMGNRAKAPAADEGERRSLIMRFNDGAMLVCPAPTHTEDGIPFLSGCYASLNKLD